MTESIFEPDRAMEQARAQLDSIIEMVEHLEHSQECTCGGDREECELTLDLPAEDWKSYHDEDEALEAIHQDPLSVLVRSDSWYSPGEAPPEPDEYEILLCTGGPAVRIIGDLDCNNQPKNARMEFQDWGTSWEYYGTTSDEDKALLAYAQVFCFD